MMRTVIHQRFVLVPTISLVLLCGSALVAGEPPPSYLSGAQLLDLYESMYSSIYNMHVMYTYRQEAIPSSQGMDALDRLVPIETVDRIEEGDRYHVRCSSAPTGFDRAEDVMEHAFNGSITKEYFPRERIGSIVRGKTGRNVETMNELKTYMFLDKLPLPEDPNIRDRLQRRLRQDARMIHGLVSRNGQVRPRLEQVAGEWCHVLDTLHPVYSTLGSTMWFAADKGGLPLKYERYGPDGKCTLRLVTQEVGTTKTQTGQVWYLKEFVADSATVSRRVVCHELQVNIPTDKTTWTFSFPYGTLVHDEVLGTSYTIGVEDASVAVVGGHQWAVPGAESPLATGSMARASTEDANETPASTSATRVKLPEGVVPAMPAAHKPYHTTLLVVLAVLLCTAITVTIVLRLWRQAPRQEKCVSNSGDLHRS